jgi:hypothetical protein
MTSIWVESLGRNFEAALDLMAAAVRDCTDELWESSMWEVPAEGRETNWLAPRVTNPAARHALVQRHSTPWGVSWHALECLDYDLTGEFGPWAPPPPFAGIGGWQITSLPAAWTRSDILGYIDYCRQRVRDTLDGMTDEKAATPLPPAHRYHGQPHAWILTGAVGHTIEHGSQIRQFITAAGISADTQALPTRRQSSLL